MTNEQRADRARRALATYYTENEDEPNSLQQSVTDFLADALHLAKEDNEQLDLDIAALAAQVHFADEKGK